MSKLTLVTQIAPGDDPAVFTKLIDSGSFADQLIVYQMGKADSTILAQLEHSEAIVHKIKIPIVVEEIRARQVHDCPTDWVLVMDFDEIITPALAEEIRKVINSSPHQSAYFIKRRNFSLGYPLTRGGWGEDLVVRLFYRPDFIDWSQKIHSLPTFKGKSGILTHFMEHHKDASLNQMVEKTNRYSEIEAKQFFEGGLPPVTPLTLFRKMHMEILRRGVFKLGILDGPIGIIQSIYQGFSVFVSYAKLFEKQQNRNHEK